MTETFEAGWLALREPYDHAARAGVAADLLAELTARAAISVVDLGAGSGSNLRCLAPHLGPRQSWRLLDADAGLLAGIAAPPGTQVTAEVVDLAAIETVALGADLVTATAFLDLVSADWLGRLVACLDGAAVLFALSYDGRIDWDPVDSGDALARELVNRHQRTDKGFGPALGPDAARHGVRQLAAAGYAVVTADTAWRLGPGDAAIQQALLAGYREAAAAIASDRAGEIAAWAGRRDTLIAEGRSHLIVGHTDLWAAAP